MQLQQIVERCQQGDREAIAQLYVTMRKPLQSVCLHYVKNETVAEDLLHDVFLHIFDKIGMLKDPSRAEAWMTTLAQRVVLQHLRQQRQEQKQLTAYALKADRPQTEAPLAEAALTAKEIMAAVDALPEGYRRVFTLAVLEGKTHQEIGKMLNIEPHSSSSQFYHARMLLRRWLRPMLLMLLAVGLPLGVMRWLPDRRSGETAERAETAPVLPTDGRGGESEAGQGEAPIEPTPHALEQKRVVAQSKQPERREAVAEEKHVVAENTADGEGNAVTEGGTLGERSDLAQEEPVAGEEVVHRTGSEDHRWSVELAYSSGMGGNGNLALPYANADTNPIAHDSLSQHRMPLAVSLSLNYRLDKHWQLGTGLVYTRQTSDFRSGNTYVSLHQQQTVQQLGIPVSVAYHWPLSRRLEVYGAASVTLHIPLRATLDSHYLFSNGTEGDFSSTRLHPGLQWSAGIAAGLQYNLTPHVSFFVEPSLHHYFPNSSNVSTWTTEHPLAPSFPFGLRLSF